MDLVVGMEVATKQDSIESQIVEKGYYYNIEGMQMLWGLCFYMIQIDDIRSRA